VAFVTHGIGSHLLNPEKRGVVMGESSAGRGSRWTGLLVCALLALAGCSRETPQPASPPKAPAEVPEVKVSPIEGVLEATGISLTAASALDDEQLKTTGAQSHERLISDDPGLEILLLSYADAKATALALPTVTSWANRSKVKHQAEAMGEGRHLLLVGLRPGDQPTDDTKAVVNKLLNAFVSNAKKL